MRERWRETVRKHVHAGKRGKAARWAGGKEVREKREEMEEGQWTVERRTAGRTSGSERRKVDEVGSAHGRME